MKNIFFSLAIFLLLSAPSAIAAAEKESAYERVMRTGVIRCAYASVGRHIRKDANTQQVIGPIPEIMEAVTESLSLKLEWTAEVGYADFAEGLNQGRYDMFCGALSVVPSRARVVQFTHPIFFTLVTAYVRAAETRFTDLSSLNVPNVKAATIDGEGFQKVTNKYLTDVQEISYPNMTQGDQILLDLVSGKVDTVVHDAVIVRDFLQNNPGTVKRLFEKPLEIFPYAFAVSPKEHSLKNMIDSTLLYLHALGRIDEILERNDIDDATYYRVSLPYAPLQKRDDLKP